jgi:oligosaccharide repeat unit polymerase
MLAAGLVTVALSRDGHFCHGLGALITVGALLLYWLEDPRFFRLSWMWCGGFLLIIAPEGLSAKDQIVHLYGDAAYDTASRCLVASHFAMLLGHDLIFSEQRIRPPSDQWVLSASVVTRLIFATWIVSVLYLVPYAIQTYRSGRAGEEFQSPSAIRAVFQGFVTATNVIVPITSMWLAKRARGRARLLLLVMAGTIIGLQFLMAVRFMLLFVIVGSAIAWTAPRRPSRRTIGILLGLAVIMAFASTVLTETRTFGMGEADVGRAARSFSTDDFAMSEGTVQSMTQAVVYADHKGYTDGKTSAALLVFWIPRAIWPTKPTLIGYWLPREFDRQGFGRGFSSAPGFTGATYVDFGLWGSVAFWFIGGLIFGLFERWVARICAAEEDARILLAAPLFGGAFFAVRSIETASLMLVGVMLAATVILVVGARRRPRPAVARTT